MTNNIQLYELVNNFENPISFSPFVIAIKLILKHKGLEFETIQLTLSEVKPIISKLTKGKWSKVPLLKFQNGDLIYNSLKIGVYLESIYPSPSLNINNPKLDQLMFNYDKISDLSFSLSIWDLYNILEENDKFYFLQSRPILLGMSIEEFTKDLGNSLKLYHQKTINIGEILDNSPYLNGKVPGIYDYFLAGRIQYIRLVSPQSYYKLIANHPKKSIINWFENMLSLFDGYLRDANRVRA